MGDTYTDGEWSSAPLAPCTDAAGPESTGKWYVEYYDENDFECVKDCQGPRPCNGRPSSYKELYETFNICCEHHTWWKMECDAYDEDGNGGEPEYSQKYFANYETGSCLQDCEPESEFGCAQVPPPVTLYDSIEACCTLGQTWVDISYCTSRSMNGFTDGWVVDYTNGKCGESNILYMKSCSYQ